jgi:hypothetical protein
MRRMLDWIIVPKSITTIRLVGWTDEILFISNLRLDIRIITVWQIEWTRPLLTDSSCISFFVLTEAASAIGRRLANALQISRTTFVTAFRPAVSSCCCCLWCVTILPEYFGVVMTLRPWHRFARIRNLLCSRRAWFCCSSLMLPSHHHVRRLYRMVRPWSSSLIQSCLIQYQLTTVTTAWSSNWK